MPQFSQSNISSVLVIDASAVINLIASKYAREIIKALPNRKVILAEVISELEAGVVKGRSDGLEIREMANSGLFEIVALDASHLPRYEDLVIGPASATLDDGEAATIAYSIGVGGIAIIDERKAIRICAERYPEIHLGSSVDIFSHQKVQNALGTSKLKESILNALIGARMSVLPHQVDWVLARIGSENSPLCRSLPRVVREKQGNK
jgi:hypothetical protein